MPSPRCFRRGPGAALGATALLAAVLGVSACSSSGPVTSSSGGAAAGEAPASRRAEAAVEIPPEAASRYATAIAFLESGDAQRAEAELQGFVRQYPGYPGPWVNLAIIYYGSGRAEAAVDAVDRALRLDPDHPAALNQLGILHREAGQFAEAEAAYLKAITVKPGYALAHFNLGVLNDLYLGRPDEALSHYREYQALTGGRDETVEKWIVDLARRVEAGARTAQAGQ